MKEGSYDETSEKPNAWTLEKKALLLFSEMVDLEF